MHRVYINDKLLIFEDVYGEFKFGGKNLLILSESVFTLDEVIEKIKDIKTNGIVYLCASPGQVWSAFAGRFILIEAAGGLVRNENGECLVIFRKKVWDLPKGKLDYNESPEQAAVREVKEECGLKKVVLNNFLLDTFHTFSEKNKFILKKTHWYTMTSSLSESLVPQTGENIEKVKWMNKDKIHQTVFPNSYASILDVFEEYYKKN